jgi:glycosyltransferase involved in cell wall biosynthesis
VSSNTPVISIIIPCYNDAQYIEQSVQSALNQTYPYKEIIIVDDGSNAETKAILKKIEPRITKLITQENQGQSTARNVGIKAAKGEYILILDSDDYFEPTFCEEAITAFKSDENIVIVTCQANLLFPDGSTQPFIPQGGNIGNFMYANCALGTSMFKKADWAKVGGYDETMRRGLEDWEFFINLLKNGGYCYVIPVKLFNYRKREFSTTSRALKVKYDILKYIFLKHKEIYRDNIEVFIEVFSDSLKKLENEKIKVLNSKEYTIGNKVLKPLRIVKKTLNYLTKHD